MQSISIDEFQSIVMAYYHAHGRHDLPWRQPEADESFDPYKILVSEMMLQQTQVGRVIPKYREFLRIFPDVISLSHGTLECILLTWNGLGYNRRAKYLWYTAKQIESEGAFPTAAHDLQNLPGIGPNTAGAIIAYAFNKPVCFIETNIRTVFIYHFFNGQHNISDNFIRDLVDKTMDYAQPRQWYWALMDYGSFLKTNYGNLNTASKHYIKQTSFAGSVRQIRGRVIRLLLETHRDAAELRTIVDDPRLGAVLDALLKERLIVEKNGTYGLST